MVRTRSFAGGREPPTPVDGAPARGRSRGRPRGRGRVRATTPARDQEQAPSVEPVTKVEQDHRHSNGVGSAQPSPGFVVTPLLQDTLARILSLMEGMSQAGTLPCTSASPQVRDEVQTLAQTGALGVQVLKSQSVTATHRSVVQPVPTVAPPMAVRPVMSSEEQKMLRRFFKLDPPRFSGAVGEDAHDFLVSCQERLHILGLVELHGVDYIAFQMDGPAKQWWRSYLECRPGGSPPMTWAQFSEAFLDKYLPRSLREQLRDEFTDLVQGSMSVSEYETRFHELAKHAAMLMPTEHEKVRRFVKGLTFPLRLATEQMVALGGSFLQVVDHARIIERIRGEAYGGSEKRPRRQGHFSGSQSRGRGFQGRGYPQQFQPSRSVQMALQITNGGLVGAGDQGSQASDKTFRCSHLGYSSHGGHSVPAEPFLQVTSGRGCYKCGELGHFVRDCRRDRLLRQQGQHFQVPRAPVPLARGGAQGSRGGSQSGRSGGRGGRGHMYAFPSRLETEASDAVITGFGVFC